jgi:AcrR family transcriptional regulator
MPSARPHTGRRRNEAARAEVHAATLRLLRRGGYGALTMTALAREAAVGKQTLYRWYGSPADIVIEIAWEHGRALVRPPDTGSLRGDVIELVAATYAGAAQPQTRLLLRAIAAEAMRDPTVATRFEHFTSGRRRPLIELLERAVARGELAPGTDAALLADLVYGLLWYHALEDREHPGDQLAERVTDLLLAGAAAPRAPLS